METIRQPGARWLVRALLAAAVAAFSAAAGAQSRPAVSPPPTDLEPGVNTSATQTSSPEPAPAPVSEQKPRQTPPKAAASTAAGAAGAGVTNTRPPAPTSVAVPSAPAGDATAAGATGTARTAASPKSGASGAPTGKAHDSLQLDTTQITGNRELPKVLYIVPWKRSDLGDLVGKPVNSLLDEVLTPVDRDVFKRQNRYYDALKPDDAKDAAGAAAGADVKH
jgi:hypothetical protein